MSRLCRLKSYKNIGEDGRWAYDEIVKLQALCDQMGEALEELYCSEWAGLDEMQKIEKALAAWKEMK